jgi:thiosulfate dehydrogenase (quinone)
MATSTLSAIFGVRDENVEAVPDFGLALRASEIAMGFIFLAGGWRRFYNVPAKHDVESVKHLSGKLAQAAPGSPIEDIIHWVLYKPALAELSVYFMSSAEVVVGLGLIFGFMTRLAGVGSAGLNVAMMLIFGWMGYECLDEYTMSALGFAISISAMIYGAGSYSLDSKLKIDPLGQYLTKNLAIALTVVSVLFTVGFYEYYFGVFKFHKRTSDRVYSIVAEPTDKADISTLYVNAGGSSSAAYVNSITFTLKDGSKVKQLPKQIEVLRSHFEPWSKSGIIRDGVLRLRLGSKVDIRIPSGAESAKIDLIDNKKDPVVNFK